MKYLRPFLSLGLFLSLSTVSTSYSQTSIGDDFVSLRNSCSLMVYVSDNQYFDTEDKAKSYCETLYNINGVSKGCFTRELDVGYWESNFGYFKGFVGTNSMIEYAEWAKSSVHKGFIIRHELYYSGKCQDEYPY